METTLNQKLMAAVAPTVEHNGRHFITMGHPGFNTKANNRNGFASKARAEAQIRIWSRDHILRKMDRDWKRSEKVED